MNEAPRRPWWRLSRELVCVAILATGFSSCHQRVKSQPQQSSQLIQFSHQEAELAEQVRQLIPVGMPVSECISIFEANGFKYVYPTRDNGAEEHPRKTALPGEVLVAYKHETTDTRWLTAFLRVHVQVVNGKAGDLRADVTFTGP